ncbi:MAG: GNAT family N-acetyltransferase [Candidatus Eiseniibacteriota bacterium]|nr:MAG: GNAT family N-acetyltransferase [Candidatus Eisenbacteria bacterium]
MKQEPTIRPARQEDIPHLPAVELAASSLYADRLEELGLGPLTLESMTQTDAFELALRMRMLWVAVDSDDRPIGFALAREVDGAAHLEELDVLPSHGRKGLGSALLARVCVWARENGYGAVTLSTFRDVPWNEPFYARRGFRTLRREELSAGLVHLLDIERARGLRMDRRVLMRFETGADRLGT